MTDFFQIENEIKQGTYCGLWDNPDYMWEAKTINSNSPNDEQQEKKGEIAKTEQQKKTDEMEKDDLITPEVLIGELNYNKCKDLDPGDWEYITKGFKKEYVLMVLKSLETSEQQTKIFNSICDGYNAINSNNSFGFIYPDWIDAISLALKFKKIPTKERTPEIPTNADGVDYTKYSELIKHYSSTIENLSQELEANRKKEQAQQELLAASSQLQAVLEKAGEESEKLKKQNETLQASLEEKGNEIRQKDELLAQLTEEAEARKGLDEDERNRYEARIKELTEANVLLSHEKVKANNSPNKQAIINELVGEMVKEAQDWEHEERKTVNSLIMNTCGDYLSNETKKRVKELKKKKSVPMVGGDLVMEKHVGNQVNGVQAGATGVIVKGENKE